MRRSGAFSKYILIRIFENINFNIFENTFSNNFAERRGDASGEEPERVMHGWRAMPRGGRTDESFDARGTDAGNASRSVSYCVYFHFSKFCGSRYVLSMSQKALGISCVSRELGRSRLLNLKSKGGLSPTERFPLSLSGKIGLEIDLCSQFWGILLLILT